MKVIKTYEKASGQRINFDKSSIIFGKRVPFRVKQEIKDTLAIDNEGGMGKYLGIPEDISGSKCKLFAFLKDRLDHRVNGWSGRWLSKGGKEVLIKAIALALPTYVMSSFLLPLEICEKLASAIARFWWSSNPPKRGMHWAKWEKLCKPKDEGGLGFRLIHEFNLALLAKQLWRLIQFPDSLLARVMRGRYYYQSTPLRASDTASPSYVWTSLMAARPLLCLGLNQKVHSGYQIRVWEDPWIPTVPARPARPLHYGIDMRMTVNELITGDPKIWNIALLENLIVPEDVDIIRRLAISQTAHCDSFRWSYTRHGMYTVKSGYWVARNILKQDNDLGVVEPSITKIKAQAWRISAPPKIKHLIWQLVTGYIAVTGNLTRRHIRCDNHCPRCGEPDESANHAIFECPPAIQAWALAATPSCPGSFPVSSIYVNLDYLFWRKKGIENPDLDMDPYPWIIWYLWKARNDKLFKGLDRNPLDLIRHAESECKAWFEANRSLPHTEIQQAHTQAPSLMNICLVDGSWKSDAQFSGFGWVWKDERGVDQLIGLRNKENRMSSLHSELEALIWAMEVMQQQTSCQHFGTDCKELITMVQDPKGWPSFSTEIEDFMALRRRFWDFKISYVPRQFNRVADDLARTARSFYRNLLFIGCSIPVWITRPPHVL